MIPKDLTSYYKLHSPFYDLTRWSFLFGRSKVKNLLPDLPKKSRILDLGCGTGKHLHTLCKKYPTSEIIGLDLSSDMLLKSNHTSVIYKNMKYDKHTFEANSLDMILCSYSLSMMPDIDTNISAITYHLKKEAFILVIDFNSTPIHYFSNWMKMNHVNFELNLIKKLEKYFELEFKLVKHAYFGLYTYSIFLGKLRC